MNGSRTVGLIRMQMRTDLPAITPPRFSSADNSRSTGVFKYVVANTDCLPPLIHTPVACLSGSANRSASACSRDAACSNATDAGFRVRQVSNRPSSSGVSVSAVGITSNFACVPPANSKNRSRTSAETFPPPCRINVPSSATATADISNQQP